MDHATQLTPPDLKVLKVYVNKHVLLFQLSFIEVYVCSVYPLHFPTVRLHYIRSIHGKKIRKSTNLIKISPCCIGI
jgi:hypothetical protein